MHVLQEHIALTFGVVLAAALLAGLVADLLRLPKVTGYLLIGVVLGPSVFDLLAAEHVHTLDPFTKLAIGLILFGLGCHFPLPHLRRVLRCVAWIATGELLVTFALVSVGLVLIGLDWSASLLLGSLALATAPATTILVLKETESEGPVTEYVDALVIVNNVAAIIVFELVFLAIHMTTGTSETPWYVELGLVLQDVGGSVILGVLAGVVVSYTCGLLSPSRWLVLLIAGTTFVLGLAEWLGTPFMLCFLMMGVTVANTSDHVRAIVKRLDGLTAVLCVVFFVIHGAELDLKSLQQAGLIGAAYVVLRTLGKYSGAYLGARLSRESPDVRNWLGFSLLAQAGAAIALAAVAVQRDAELGKPIQTIILGTIVVFEIVGPLLIRLAVMQAGEVPLARALHHTSKTPLGELAHLWTRLMIALGRDPRQKRSPQELKVSDLMRKNVAGLLQSASYNEVISLIEHSHDNTYAVIDQDGALVGVIRYAALSQVAFDPSAASLICAADLASAPDTSLYDDDPAARAMELFRQTTDDCIPVVTHNPDGKYVGMARRRDVVLYASQQGD